jgi:pyridoxal phosphate-dependent aminotransferase EpsN
VVFERAEDRDAAQVALEAADIESRPLWKPMHLQPLYASAERFGGAVAEDLFARGICLPSSSSLTPAEQNRVIEVVRAACRR